MRRVVMMSKGWLFCAGLGLAFAACGDGDPKVVETPVDPESERRCPETATVEALQFNEGFENPANLTLFQGGYRFNKAYVQDVIVTPGDEQKLTGRFFRSANGLPGTGTGVAGENLYFFAGEGDTWTQIATTTTDSTGKFSVTLPESAVFDTGNHRILTVLGANGACVESGVFVWPEDTQLITTDIDATLTISDDENIRQMFTDITYVQKQAPLADVMMNTWYDKGYEVSYVTARPWDYQGYSRVWLREEGFPFGPLELAEGFVHGSSAAVYKQAFVERLLALGFDFVAAYGNALSDVDGFLDGGIPVELVWTMGESAGYRGGHIIEGPGDKYGEHGDYADYTTHIEEFVEEQPDATRTFPR